MVCMRVREEEEVLSWFHAKKNGDVERNARTRSSTMHGPHLIEGPVLWIHITYYVQFNTAQNREGKKR